MARPSGPRSPAPDDRGSLQPDFRLLAVATVCLLALLALSAVGPAMSGGPGGGGVPGDGNGESPIWGLVSEYLPTDLLVDAGRFVGEPIQELFLDSLDDIVGAIDPETVADVAKAAVDLLEHVDPETLRDIGGALADVLPLLNGGMNSPGSGDDGGGSNQLLETVLGAIAVAIVLGIVAWILWRWGDVLLAALRRAGGRSASVLRALPSLLVDLAVRTGRAIEAAAGRVAAGVRQLVLDPAETIRSALVGLPGALRALPGRIAAALLSLLVAVLPDRLVAWLRRVLLGEEPADAEDGAGAPGAAELSGGADGGSILDLQALWRAFVAAVRPPNLPTKTPGEVGRYAVDRGFPTGPTRTIVDTYRAAEYGDREPSAGRLERVLDAVREIAGDDAPDGDLGESVDPAAPPEDGDAAEETPADDLAAAGNESNAEVRDAERADEPVGDERPESDPGGDGS